MARLVMGSSALALLLLTVPARGLAAGDVHIAVLSSQDAAPYQELLAGFREFLVKEGVTATFDAYGLQGNAGKAAEAIREIKKRPPRLIVTIGALATQTVLRDVQDIPVVAGLVSHVEEIKKSGNATGVMLDFPLETQFQWMQKLVPGMSSVGVLYNPNENQAKIDAASKAAQKAGFSLVAKEIETPRAIPDALESLSKSVDILWGTTDQLVLSPQTAESILLFSFRSRVPFTGLSASWVKAGSLYALDRDYKDLGAQCGELAVRILNGTKPNALPPVPPRRVLYSLNQKTADHMKVEFSRQIVEGAQQVFR